MPKRPAKGEVLRRIQGLPQELQDEILLLALKAGVQSRAVRIHTKYKPPWQLQVNRHTRKEVSEHYYATSTFTLTNNYFSSKYLAVRCLGSITVECQVAINDIRTDVSMITSTADRVEDWVHDGNEARVLENALQRDHGIQLKQGVMKVVEKRFRPEYVLQLFAEDTDPD